MKAHKHLVWLESQINFLFFWKQIFSLGAVLGFSELISSQMSDHICVLQKRKVEPVPLATQVSPATPVPSLPSSAEATQAAVFPAVRETNTFKTREDHDQLSSLTTVSRIVSQASEFRVCLCMIVTLLFGTIEWHCKTTRPHAAREEEES